MVESNQDFDDFELGEDAEDPWDDIIDDNDNAEEALQETLLGDQGIAPKKKSFVKPLMILLFLGGGGYMLLPLLIPDNAPNHIPIVKLGEPLQPGSDQAPSPIHSFQETLEHNIIEDNNIPHTNETESAPTDKIQTKYNDSVLTPLPENIAISGIPLPELVGTALLPTNISDNKVKAKEAETPIATPTPIILSEETLLSKTDKIFEDFIDLSSEAVEQDISTISSAPVIETNTSTESLEAPATSNVDIAPSIPTKIVQNIAQAPEYKEKNTDNIEVLDIKAPKVKTSIIKEPLTKKPVSKKIPIWVIRAAQSNSAVIFDKTSKEMKSIEVGDAIRGLGRIKSIKIINGSWVIFGTKGKVEQ